MAPAPTSARRGPNRRAGAGHDVSRGSRERTPPGRCQRGGPLSRNGHSVSGSTAAEPGGALLLEGGHALRVVGRLADDRHVRGHEVEVRTQVELEALVHET